MNIAIPKGVFDILPKDPDPKNSWRNSAYWEYVESIIYAVTKTYGFQEIRTPVFERTELFKRGVGETSDIVSKEMYSFEDKAGRSMTLRPEGTAAVMRSVIEKRLCHHQPFLKLFYIGPMFRYERPQSGRYRQHHQFGIEAIGHSSPEQDVEVIDMIHVLYQRLGLKDLTIQLNTLGTPESRNAFRESLQEYLRPHLGKMSEDSQLRFETNPLRILDSKAPQDIEIVTGAPSILDCLDEESCDHFALVRHLLEKLKIPYVINPKLVRGLDYYTKTVFEITSGQLGAQNSIGGGGRYDGLIKSLGGPDLPAVGFATGIERIIQTMLGQNVSIPLNNGPKIFLIPLGEAARDKSFEMLHEMRAANINAEMDFSNKKLKQIMQYANNIEAKYVVILGDNELTQKEIELKCMADGTTQKIAIDSLTEKLKNED